MNAQSLEVRAAQLERQRWWTLIVYGATWLVWMLVSLPPIEHLPLLQALPMEAIGTTAMFAWFASFAMLILVLLRIRRDRRLCGTLNDELSRANWMRSTSAGYYVLMAAVVVVAIAAKTQWLDMRTGFLMLIMVAVGVPLGVNIWLERDTAEG